jgi:hypothetical protein
MGPVANGGGEAEEENLRAIETLRDIFDSFAKKTSDERAPVGDSRRVTRSVYIGFKFRERVSWVGSDG